MTPSGSTSISSAVGEPTRRRSPRKRPTRSVPSVATRRRRDAAPAEHGSYADHEPAALDEPAAAYDDEPLAYDDEEPLADDDQPVVSEPPTTHDRPYAEPAEESATPPHGDPLAHQPTREFSATELDEALGHEEALPPAPAPAPAAESGEEEDVLEETPDFLQETPEHDRLWFEQKPPKDFDF